MAVLHDMLMKVIVGSTCRTQTSIVQNVRKKPSEDLAASVFTELFIRLFIDVC